MERRGSKIDVTDAPPPRDEGAVVIAREAFAAWLRAERETRGIALEEIARVTKIQFRTLQLLEGAEFDELPADVFVRGFIRNYARVVGLDANLAIARYDDCGVTPGPAAAARAKAMLETVTELAPKATTSSVRRLAQGTPSTGTYRQPEVLAQGSLPEIKLPVIEPEPVIAPVIEAKVEPVAEPKKKRGKGRGKGRGRAKKKPVVEAVSIEDLEVEIEIVEEPEPVVVAAPRRIAKAIPTLVIDDDDPDSAERVQAARALDEKVKRDGERSFLPPALLENKGGRQAGLTLAVIILLILATLTLSYLMRPPGSSGEGVTSLGASSSIG